MGQKSIKKTLSLSNQIGEGVVCPLCQNAFSKETSFKIFNIHLKNCGKEYLATNATSDIFLPSEDKEINEDLFERIKNYNKKKKQNAKMKEFDTFENKILKLKEAILKRKISWEKGFCQININRKNYLIESMKQIKKIDLFKELKINFIGEVSYDAGGIEREWFTILFQNLEGEKLNLFHISDSQEFSYIINPFLKNTNKNLEYFNFIGKLIGKALLDNITINICFNKLIYKLILEEEITFDDLVFIDTPLYNSLKNLKNTNINNLNDLNLYYTIEQNDINGQIHTFNLIKNGNEIPIKTIDDYIKKRIDFMISQIEIFCKEIRNSLYKLIPKEILEKMTSDELELIINGKPFIDIEEWKSFTQYREPLNSNSQIIIWFWEIMSNLNQNQLSNFLQFSTGTARVPIGGFAELESNRGNISRFTIVEIPFVNGCKNYIKAHTCFNRIELPNFPRKDLMKDAIEFIGNCEILGFGID
jgi:hypothetical protein